MAFKILSEKSSSNYLMGIFFVVICTNVSAVSIDDIDEHLENLSLEKLAYVQSRPENSVAPFTTDGCSGGMSDGWQYLSDLFPSFNNRYGNKPPWESCCITHDRAYWQGETINGYMKRKQADHDLRTCVVETGKSVSEELANKQKVSVEEVERSFEMAAELMYRAVRVGGKPCSRLPWRWGYGWPHCPLYIDDNPDEESIED